MSIYSLETLSKEGAIRISVEFLLVFVVVTLAYVVAVEPLLQSIYPDVYAQTGLDYGRYDSPDTPSEITHLFLSVVIAGSFFYWRLNCTELGARLEDAIREDY